MYAQKESFKEKLIALADINTDEKDKISKSNTNNDCIRVHQETEESLKKLNSIKNAPLNIFTWGDLCY